MRFAAIGRTEMLFDTVQSLIDHGHELTGIITAKAEPHYRCSEGDFQRLAVSHGVPFGNSGQLSDVELALLHEGDPSIAVSVNWPTRIQQTVLDGFPFGVLNAHAGDIPRYRGNACLNWAILRGEPEVAVVVHQMLGDRIDEGPVYSRSRISLSRETYIGELYEWLRRSIPQLFLATVEQFEETGSALTLTQHPGPPLRCYPRAPEDALIDWKKSTREIHALIRASSHPFAGAFCPVEGGRLIVWRASPVEHEVWGEICAVPGQVLRGPNGCIGVATGDGALALEEYQAHGDKVSEIVKTRSGRLV